MITRLGNHIDHFLITRVIIKKAIRWFNPEKIESAFEIPNLKKTIIKYNLEEYFRIDVQMKVIGLEFLILSILLDSPMLS
jgi:hypothetical protein